MFFYVDLGENMQLRFIYSTMPKWKISSIIPMYIHIFFPDLKSISRESWQNYRYLVLQEISTMATPTMSSYHNLIILVVNS